MQLNESQGEPFWYIHYWCATERTGEDDSGNPTPWPREWRCRADSKKAEAERYRSLKDLASTCERKEPLVLPPNAGEILFGILAEIWEWDYVERLVGGKPLIAASTKGKYRNPLHNHYSAALGGNHRLISTLHGLPSKPARTFLPSLFFSLSQPYQMPPQRAKPKPDAV